MAYQNVGTPIFYIDSLNWRKSIGADYIGGVGYNVDGSISYDIPAELVGLNPSSQSIMHTSGANPVYSYVEYLKTDETLEPDGTSKNFVALLGHNSNSANCSFHFGGDGDTQVVGVERVNYANGVPSFGGWSLATNIPFGATVKIYSTPDELTGAEADNKWGAVAYGNYYQMPHSPDLNLTMAREYGGTKTIETRGGASLSNTFYTKPPAWGQYLGAWELSDSSGQVGIPGSPEGVALSKSGRRIWSLSWSFLSDSSAFPETSALSNLEHNNYEDGDSWSDNTLLTDDNFYSQVLHRLNGGQLRFLFQPNSSNNSPDQFAICKLDQSSFKFTQKSVNTYSLSLKIREVW